MESTSQNYTNVLKYFQSLLLLITISYFRIGLYYISNSVANILYGPFALWGYGNIYYVVGGLTFLALIVSTVYYVILHLRHKKLSSIQPKTNEFFAFFILFFITLSLFIYQGYAAMMQDGECYPIFTFYLIPLLMIGINTLYFNLPNNQEKIAKGDNVRLSTINFMFVFYFLYFLSYNIRFNNSIGLYLIIIVLLGFIVYYVYTHLKRQEKKDDGLTIVLGIYTVVCYISLIVQYTQPTFMVCT